MKKSNKILVGVMSVCLMGGVVPSVCMVANNTAIVASAEYTEGTYEQLKYINYGDYIEISGCDESATEVVIPSEIESVPVTSIGYGAFLGCSNLSSIIIPDSVINISRDAFNDTPWFLEKQKENPLVIVNNILVDGSTCSGNVIIPDGVKTICDGAFFDCSDLTSIKIPNSVTSIGSLAFFSCKNLTEIIIPNGVTSIGADAFYFCEKLTSITLSDSLTKLGWEWFIGCKSLKEINIPNSVTYIGYGALAATGLIEVKLPDSVTEIAPAAFSSCFDLTSITIPNNVTSIGLDAFSWCRSLTSITILNPDCTIDSSETTISNGRDENFNIYFNGTIYGYENSTAQAYAENYNYKFESLGEAPTTTDSTMTGDANGDNKINISDAVLIMQSISNPSEYKISDSAKLLADVVDGDGITNKDALAIQMVEAKLLDAKDFPIASADLNKLM